MPELPEVQCVVDSLKRISGKKIVSVKILNDRLREPVQLNLNDLLKDKIILEIERRGKFIIFKLNSGDIVSHLGMTGKFLIQESLIENKFNRIVLELDDGSFLIYNDIRKFGFITYEENYTSNKYIKKLGVEPLSENFTADLLYELTRNKKTNIKQFLLDQSFIVGLGNIYVIEVLYLCKISPKRMAKDVNKDNCIELVEEIKRILKNAISNGGSSISDYRDADDKEGSFQDSHKIYNKKIDPLGHDVLKIKQGGRGTNYCPICQFY